MAELTALLLKAVQLLPPEERDQVMAELLDARLQSPPSPALSMPLPHSLLPHAPPGPGEQLAELRQSLTMEAAGPWQAVPVRLPVELHERLRQWCQANGFTMAVVLRGLVARFLDEYGVPGGTPAAQPGVERAAAATDQPRRPRNRPRR